MGYYESYDHNKWRHLYAGEKELMKRYYEAQYKLARIFFRIPQCVAVVVTIALFVDIIIKWDDYVSDVPQMLAMLCLGIPFLWGLFFFGPKWLMKALSREENAIETDRALVSERTIISKTVAYQGSSASGHPRRYYEFEIEMEGLDKPTAFIHTNQRAYERLNAGDACFVLYCPRESDKKVFAVFMQAFLIDFEEVKSAFGTKLG